MLFRSGEKLMLWFILDTGSGKTVRDASLPGRDGASLTPLGCPLQSMFTSLIRRLPPLIHPHHSTLATRVLVIVGSVELARQARDTIERTWPDLVSGSSDRC